MRNDRPRTTAALVASAALHLIVWRIERALPRPERATSPSYGVVFELLRSETPLTSSAAVEPGPSAEPSLLRSRAEPRASTQRSRAEPHASTPAHEAKPARGEPLRRPTPSASTRPESEAERPTAPPAEQDAVAASQGSPASVAAPVASALPTGSGRPTRDLSPRAAAHTLVGETEASWTIAESDTPAEDALDCAHEAQLAEPIAALTRAGRDPQPVRHLLQDALAVVSKPWDLILRPFRKARYHYRGTGFDAVIRADGSIQYRSKDGLQLATGSVQGIDGESVSTFGIGVRNAPVEKLFGRDAHASERRRFLEQTRALRELLYARAVRVALLRADAHLTQRLRVIEQKLAGGDAPRARADLFALWDECAEDEVGTVARTRIERFVRAHCERGSARTFSDQELLALNQKRVSRRPFAPYAESDAGIEPARLDIAGP